MTSDDREVAEYKEACKKVDHLSNVTQREFALWLAAAQKQREKCKDETEALHAEYKEAFDTGRIMPADVHAELVKQAIEKAHGEEREKLQADIEEAIWWAVERTIDREYGGQWMNDEHTQKEVAAALAAWREKVKERTSHEQGNAK